MSSSDYLIMVILWDYRQLASLAILSFCVLILNGQITDRPSLAFSHCNQLSQDIPQLHVEF